MAEVQIDAPTSFERDNFNEPSPTNSTTSVSDEMLFSIDSYTVTPTVDGQATDTLDVSFGGKVSFNALDREARELFESLTLGREVELRVSGTIVKKSGAYKRSKNDEEVVTGTAGIKIEQLYIVPPEQL